jgi:hypothetical protein
MTTPVANPPGVAGDRLCRLLMRANGWRRTGCLDYFASAHHFCGLRLSEIARSLASGAGAGLGSRRRRRKFPARTADFAQGEGQNTRSWCPSGSAARKVRPKSLVTGSCRMAAPFRFQSRWSASTSSLVATAIASSPAPATPPAGGFTSR